MHARLLSIQTGKVAPLGRLKVLSGFVKHAVAGSVAVGPLGLAGDEQADLSVHGGPEKAVYAYAAAHYPAWAEDFPRHRERLHSGAFGENLTIAGMTEADICVGDVHAIGSAVLQVCQPRQPCFKFAEHFEDSRMPKAMVRNGRAGWYYRVLEPGTIAAGDEVALVERPNPEFGFARLVAIVSHRDATPDEFAALAAMEGVASWIRNAAQANTKLG